MFGISKYDMLCQYVCISSIIEVQSMFRCDNVCHTLYTVNNNGRKWIKALIHWFQREREREREYPKAQCIVIMMTYVFTQIFRV